MKVSRWEKERAAWLLARSKPGTVRRRRAELLSRQARHLGRGHTSAGESALHDDATERLFVRLMKTDEGSVDKLARLVLVPAGYAAMWLLVGAAVAVAAAIYRALWAAAPKIGRLWAWPWAVAGVVLGISVWCFLDHTIPVNASVWPRYMVLYVDGAQLWTSWMWIQLTLGLLFTSLYVRAAGWAAVPKHAALKPKTDRDGEFVKTPDRQKVRLDPLAGVEATKQPADHSEAPSPAIATTQEFEDIDDLDGPVFADDDPVFEAVDDEGGPVFADEDMDNNIVSAERRA